jgi:hypothetical protein
MEIEVTPHQAELVSYGTPNYETNEYNQEGVYEEGQETNDATSNAIQANEEVSTKQEEEVTSSNIEPPADATAVDDTQQESREQQLFAEMFEKTFGVPPEVLKQELENTRLERERQQAEKELNKLRSSWGVDDNELNSRLTLIKERLEALPEASRTALDNPEGINLIWNAIQTERGSVQQVPRYERSSTVNTASNKPMFTREQLKAMPPEEYRRNNDQILYAYQHGLVV